MCQNINLAFICEQLRLYWEGGVGVSTLEIQVLSNLRGSPGKNIESWYVEVQAGTVLMYTSQSARVSATDQSEAPTLDLIIKK